LKVEIFAYYQVAKENFRIKASRFTEEQIVRALREVEAGGKTAVEQQLELQISNATWSIWKRKYGGLEVNEASRLKVWEQENNKLKRIVANRMLENEAVKEVLSSAVAC
jgi:putative transposase